jgi:hypothetical protein
MSFWKKFARKKLSDENNASPGSDSQDNSRDQSVGTRTNRGLRPNFADLSSQNQEFSSDVCGLFTLSGNNPPDHFHIE